MKTLERTKTISISLISIGAIIISILPTPSFAQTPSKRVHMAGRVTTIPANTIHSGKGVPTNEIGIDGDFYIDTLKLNFYGPKESGHWPAPVSLRGPAGVNGVDGKAGTNGVDGKAGVNGEKGSSSSSSGTPGAQGLQGIEGPIGLTGAEGPIGLTGAAGPTGANGSPGVAGSTGAQGPIGATGLTGSSGSQGPIGLTGSQGSTGTQGPIGLTGLQGSQGNQGATGAQGAQGSQGIQGIQGAQGIQGVTGATGPSQILMGSITFSQLLQGGTRASVTSNSFGNFAAGKDYFVHLLIYGVRSQADFASLRVVIYAQGATPLIQTNYVISDGGSYRTASDENDTNLDVDVTIDGSSVSTPFELGATISSLDDTTSDSVTFAGSYLQELVGSLT